MKNKKIIITCFTLICVMALAGVFSYAYDINNPFLSDSVDFGNGYNLTGGIYADNESTSSFRAGTNVLYDVIMAGYRTYLTASITVTPEPGHGNAVSSSANTLDQGFIGCTTSAVAAVPLQSINSSHSGTIIHQTTGISYSKSISLNYID